MIPSEAQTIQDVGISLLIDVVTLTYLTFLYGVSSLSRARSRLIFIPRYLHCPGIGRVVYHPVRDIVMPCLLARLTRKSRNGLGARSNLTMFLLTMLMFALSTVYWGTFVAEVTREISDILMRNPAEPLANKIQANGSWSFSVPGVIGILTCMSIVDFFLECICI